MSDTREAVVGLSTQPVSALRYDVQISSPYEAAGLLASLIAEGARVLDVGCGTGATAATVRDLRKVSVLGVEPHPERAAHARSRGLDVITGLFSDEIVRDHGTFDYVLFADVLEHLVDPAAMLNAVKPALAPGGRVLVSVPNVAHWTVRAKLLIGKFDYRPSGIMDATHLRWFTRDSLRRLFDACGYEIEQVRGAAGGWMHAYNYTPLRPLPQARKSALLGRLVPLAPGLLAVQHIVSARLRAA